MRKICTPMVYMCGLDLTPRHVCPRQITGRLAWERSAHLWSACVALTSRHRVSHRQKTGWLAWERSAHLWSACVALTSHHGVSQRTGRLAWERSAHLWSTRVALTSCHRVSHRQKTATSMRKIWTPLVYMCGLDLTPWDVCPRQKTGRLALERSAHLWSACVALTSHHGMSVPDR